MVEMSVVEKPFLFCFNQTVLHLVDRALGEFQESDVLAWPEPTEAF